MGIQWDTEHLVYSGGSRGYAQCAPTMAATGEDEPLVGAVGGVNESVATEHLSDVKWRDDAFPPPTGLNSFVFAFIFAKNARIRHRCSLPQREILDPPLVYTSSTMLLVVFLWYVPYFSPEYEF